jgi:hypothetical protein
VALFADGKATVRTLDIIGGADIVEGFETGSQSLEPGTVVVIDEDHPGELRASRVAYDHHVAGVVSGAGGIAPGLKLGQEGAMNGGTPVAMSGRVYVRCSAEKGVIHPGDLLTTAGTAGCAMRARDAERSQGAVLGKAMSTPSTDRPGPSESPVNRRMTMPTNAVLSRWHHLVGTTSYAQSGFQYL